MHFAILNYQQAQEFIPSEPTLAIRIFDPGYKLSDPRIMQKEGNHPGNLLRPSHWWVEELHYTFADLDPTIYEGASPAERDRQIRAPGCFNPLMAAKILKDFQKHYQNSSGVMIHCNAGLSRSPATALALTHRFNLRPEWKGRRFKMMRDWEENLKIHGRAANMWVYHLLMETEF